MNPNRRLPFGAIALGLSVLRDNTGRCRHRVRAGHRGFTSRVIANYTGGSITEFTDGSPARTVMNASLGYPWRPAVSFLLDVRSPPASTAVSNPT